MADIQEYLKKILSAVYGKDVRQSIHDGIKQCYYDGKAGTIDLAARELIQAADERMDTFTSLPSGSTSGNAELMDIRVGLDGKKYSSAGTAVREQIRKTNTIEVTNVEPTKENTQVWINPDEMEEFTLPEVNDGVINAEDTWSSEKIKNEMSSLEVVKVNADHYVTEAVEYERISGTVYTKTGETTDDANYECIKIPVTEGDAFLIQSYYGWQSPSALVFDELGDLIKYYDIKDGAMAKEKYNKPYVMPHGACTFVVNGRPSALSADARKIISSSGIDKFADTGVKNLLTIIKSSDGLEGSECVIDDVITAQTLIRSDGIIVSYENDNYKTAKIDVTPYELYHVYCQSNFSNLPYAFYDYKDDVIECGVGSGSGTASTFNDYLIVPNKAVTLILGTTNGTLSAKKIEKIQNDHMPWKNLKWACVGDSLTESNSRTTMNYHDYIALKTGINVVNMGNSGSGFMRKHDSNNAYYQRIANISTDVNVVTIMGSGNDVSLDLGTITDTGTDTLCGCINTTIDTLYSILPTVQLGIITPAPWVGYPTNTENNMSKYADAIIEICKNRGIPCLDLYRCSGLRPWDETFRALAYSKDDGNGVHPDETGHKMIASQIKSFMASLIDCL